MKEGSLSYLKRKKRNDGILQMVREKEGIGIV